MSNKNKQKKIYKNKKKWFIVAMTGSQAFEG